jgi:hypothetical protein
LEHFARLASKPGIQSSLILSRSDAAIIQSTGFDSEASPPGEDDRKLSREELARLVMSLVTAAGDLAESFDDGNHVQLLRLWSLKNEIVVFCGKYAPNIAPRREVTKETDPKYLLVVVHDPPKAT